jgi:hypothetical protein
VDRLSRITASRCVLPLAALTIVSIAGILLLYRLTDGNELADDARKLSEMVLDPLVLWGNYGSAGFSDSWGSFPPLLPLLFGLLTRAWFYFLPGFIAIRMGVLTWTAAVFFILARLMDRTPGIGDKNIRYALRAFALLPSVILTIVVIPQEEIYVAIFSMVLFAAGMRKKWSLVLFLIILTALAGKYFLLVLIVPLAFESGRPKRNIVLWGGVTASILAIYIGYHYLAFGLSPIIGHVVPYDSSLSVWALFWNLGLRLDPGTVKAVSLPIVVAGVLTTGIVADRKNLPLQHAFAVTLFVTLMLLSITFPGYILWNIPFILICAAMASTSRTRYLILLGAFLWGIGEFGANFFRGVHLALSTERSAGKSVVADAASRALGEGFPWHALQTVCLVLVLLSGMMTAWLIWRDGLRLSRRDNVSHV